MKCMHIFIALLLSRSLVQVSYCIQQTIDPKFTAAAIAEGIIKEKQTENVSSKSEIDKNPNDHVVQDKVSTREQPLSVEEQTTAGQVAEARALLRDLPPNTPLKDKRAAEKLLEEALINDNPSEKADPNARGAWADAQNAKKPSNDSGQEWFGWVKKLLKRTG